MSSRQGQAKQATGKSQVSAAAAPLTDLAGCVKPVRSRLRSMQQSFTCLHTAHMHSHYAAVAHNKDSCCVTINDGQHSCIRHLLRNSNKQILNGICTAENRNG
jgi:type IV secretory pathway VirJ component